MGDSSVLVVSDSHGHVPALTAALRWAASEALEAAVFLGDGADDPAAASAAAGFSLPWYRVRGNGDLDLSIPASAVLETSSGRRLFLAHGNRHGIDYGGETLAAAARHAGAEAALFGHTHVPFCSVLDGVFLLNPGSIGRPRTRTGPAFAVLDCPPQGPLAAHFWGLVSRGRELAVRELRLSP